MEPSIALGGGCVVCFFASFMVMAKSGIPMRMCFRNSSSQWEAEINHKPQSIPFTPNEINDANDQSPLTQAQERGKKYRQTSIQEAFSSQAVANLLKISDEDLAQLRRSNQIVFLDDGNSYVYPKCQFDGDRVIDGIDRVIAELPIVDGWTQLIFLESGDPSLQGDKPIDRLRSGDISAVVLAAGNYGRQRPV